MSQWKPVLNKHYVILLKEDIIAPTISLVSFLSNPDCTIRWHCSNYCDPGVGPKCVRWTFRNQLNTTGIVSGVKAGRGCSTWVFKSREVCDRMKDITSGFYFYFSIIELWLKRSDWVGRSFLWRWTENDTMLKTL